MQKSILTELKSKSLSSCRCCPYGFHIDRDFVQYCESIYNTAKLDKRKQEKRDHRMKHKSVESYLGLDSTVVNKSALLTTKPLINDGRKSSEKEALNALDGVMKDFESTWMESLKKKPGHVSIDSMKLATDQSETSSKAFSSRASQKAVVLSRDMLAKIREQISVSLKRTKELEAQVKSIPHLKVKLLVLDKERQRLLNELSSVGKGAPSEHHASNGSLGDSGSLYSFKLVDKNTNESISNSETLSPFICSSTQTYDYPYSQSVNSSENVPFKESGADVRKDVGTSCAVLTRDIGVGHVQSKVVSTGVGKKSVFSNLFLFRTENDNSELNISGSSDSVESGSDVDRNSKSEFPDTSQSAFEKFRSFSQDSKNKIASIEEKRSFTYSPPECISSRSYSEGEKIADSFVAAVVDPDVEKENVEIITDLRMTDLLAFEQWQLKRECFADISIKVSKEVQTDEEKSILTTGLDTSNKIVSLSSSPEVSCNEQVSSSLNFSKKTSSRIDIKSDSIPVYENLSISEKKIEVNNFLSRESSSLKDEHKTFATVGVGDIDVNEIFCFQCTEKAHARALTNSLRMRSVGTNTIEWQSELSPTDEIFSYIRGFDNSAQLPSISQDILYRSSALVKSLKPCDSVVEHLSEVSDIFHKCIDQNIGKSDIFILSSDSECESASTAVEALNIFSGSEMKNGSDVMNSSTDSVTVRGVNAEDESCGMKIVTDSQWSSFEKSSKRIMLSKEVKAACKVLNDHLLKPEGESSKEKTSNSLSIIQNEWFKVANQKNADPSVIEGYLDAFEEFSDKLLCRIVNLSDVNGNTAIHYAVSYSNFDVVSILIDSKVCDVNKKNKAGYTCIMLVALAELKCEAHYLVVERLFHMGDINVKASQNGQTALMLAVSHGKLKIVKMLIDAGAEVNLQDNDGSTALMCAAEHGHIDIVRMLLSHPECDSTIADSDGSNALTIAMEAGNKDIGLLIYANMNFSRGNSPHSVVKQRLRTPRARTPTLQSFRPSSPSARSTCSLPSAFQLS